MSWLKNIVTAKGGSSMRLVLLWAYFISFGVWIYACYEAKKMVDFPENLMKLLVGLSAAKVGQKYVESKNETPVSTTTTTTVTPLVPPPTPITETITS